MTSLETESRFAARSRIFEHGDEQEADSQQAARTEIAHHALEDIAAGLSYSPNNPRYLTSPLYTIPKEWLDQHADAIEAKLVYDFGELSLDNADVDLWQLDMIRSNGMVHVNQYAEDIHRFQGNETSAIEPLSQTLSSSDFLCTRRHQGDLAESPRSRHVYAC